MGSMYKDKLIESHKVMKKLMSIFSQFYYNMYFSVLYSKGFFF